jgi:hypothetical protein
MKKKSSALFFLVALGFSPKFASADIHTDSLGRVLTEPLNPVLLETYNREIRDSSTNYKRRSQRTFILLRHGDFGPPTQEDIDTLLNRPDWHDEGERLEAFRLYLQGQLEEAKVLIRKNIQGNVHEHEQARLLAAIALSKQDTSAAIAAYRMTWDLFKDENVYLDMLDLYVGREKPPEELLQEGLSIYPHSPGAIQVIFEAYLTAGDPSSLKKGLAISERAEKVLWPRSVDWKIRHAQVLLALHRKHDAETVLLAALDLADADPRLADQNGNGQPLRQEIFTLLETARK